MQTGGRELCLLFMQWVWEHAISRNDNCAFHKVLQLANIAGQEYH